MKLFFFSRNHLFVFLSLSHGLTRRHDLVRGQGIDSYISRDSTEPLGRPTDVYYAYTLD